MQQQFVKQLVGTTLLFQRTSECQHNQYKANHTLTESLASSLKLNQSVPVYPLITLKQSKDGLR
jgi:hypothetical protein